MKKTSIGILAIAFVLQTAAIANAQTSDDAKIRKEIEAITPDLKSPWTFDSTNSQIIFYRAINQYSLERKFLSGGHAITFKVIADTNDIQSARDMVGGLEKDLMTATNQTFTAVGGKKYVLWRISPEWIVLETFEGQGFQIAGVHRTEPISFVVQGEQEDFSLVQAAMKKKFKKFPQSTK